ncbi:MAG: 16S rRNA (cytosine(1402)-N(4))-methyltransferase, partial [Oligoflexia bacterium]|nr:16S rRNA (cytosine(1402)-N(4))-methyltransferase [Oligoflexia bacterium]
GINSTGRLEEIIFKCFARSGKKGKKKTGRIHPATRTFQALRIAVNKELDVLTDVLPKLYDLLAPGGRLLCISFHSLEDRIVKNSFKKIFENDQDNCSILTRKPIIPSEEEVKRNPRARSAKLRVLEKL